MAFESFSLGEWDPSVFATESLFSQTVDEKLAEKAAEAESFPQVYKLSSRSLLANNFSSAPQFPQPHQKTFQASTKATVAGWMKVLEAYDSYCDYLGYQPKILTPRPLKERKKIYQYSRKNNFPPHLDTIPKQQKAASKEIFDPDMFDGVTGVVVSNNPLVKAVQYFSKLLTPANIKDFVVCKTFQELEANNQRLRIEKKEQRGSSNVGDREDWFTDELFAQQQFTGTNPTTLVLASAQWIADFSTEASIQSLQEIVALLDAEKDKQSLFVQDCSYFREAADYDDDEIMQVKEGYFFNKASVRWTIGSVSLFHLGDDGKLHPLAIVIDWKGSLENSVTIFNKRLSPADTEVDQKTDWPWRFAKTCAQSSDWLRHEAEVHLANTHLIEESIIVASQRSLPEDHLVFRILYPHWTRTLSLNAAARQTLVPHVVVPLSGMEATNGISFIQYAFNHFNFTERYVPNDLNKRGFPVEKLGDERCHCAENCQTEPGKDCAKGCPKTCHVKCETKFHNYAYARNMKLMWDTLRTFVKEFLSYGNLPKGFNSDEDVVKDKDVQRWAVEIRTNGGIPTFPELKTLDDLVDAVTMCIHIASPQHTAVNYLQQYYQSFVVNKPPCLCAAPPTSLRQLKGYTEADLIKALPAARPREWLLASLVPTLLSMTVADKYNLVSYAATLHLAAKEEAPDGETFEDMKSNFNHREPWRLGEGAISIAAKKLTMSLWKLGDTIHHHEGKQQQKKGIFTWHSEELDDQKTPYMVMDPVVTAVSILI